MRRVVLELARQTLLLARAERVPWVVPAYAVACMGLVPLASHLTLGAGTRGAVHLGLAMQWLLCCAVGGWLGLRAVGLDLDHRTATITLAGPVAPGTWLLGRALGAAGALAATVVGLELVWVAVALWRGLAIGGGLVVAAVAMWLEGLLVGALVACLATRVRPSVATAATAGIWLVGHLSQEYTALLRERGAGLAATAIYTVVPDLDRLDLTTGAWQGGLDEAQVAGALAYGALWFLGLGALTVASLRTRDLA